MNEEVRDLSSQVSFFLRLRLQMIQCFCHFLILMLFVKQKGDDMTSQCQKGNADEIRHNQLQ